MGRGRMKGEGIRLRIVALRYLLGTLACLFIAAP
jgi:hypothetical protein